MTLPIPVSIRLRTATRDVHITSEVDDLAFSATSPGGFEACTLSLHRPITFTPGEVAQFGRLYIYDARNGSTVWEGRLQDPGRSAGGDGQVYQLAGVGGSAHLQDSTVPLIYVDQDMTRWTKARGASGEAQSAQVTASESPTGGDSALVNAFPAGLTVASGSCCSAYYPGLQDAGQELAVFDWSWDTGVTNANWTLRALSSSTHVVRTEISNTAGGPNSTAVIGSPAAFVIGDDKPYLQFRWIGGASSTGGSDAVWAAFKTVVIRTVTYLQDGTKQTSGYTSLDRTIKASTVVADLLGRLLTDVIDGANATIASTVYAIDQLAYPDCVSPAGVLADLLELEPAYTYHVWETNPQNDLFRFEWVPWPSDVRYEADVLDGFSSPSSGNTLYDSVRIRWRNVRGYSFSQVRTQTVPALATAGFSRTAYLDLGDVTGSLAAVQRAGDGFLAEHQYPVNAGRLVVTRPIVDYQTGRMVQPWEIRPGNLVRVRGVESYPDSLNPDGRDGLSIFRIAATSYSAADAAATLDLDSYAPSVARAVAAIVRRPLVRRR